MNKNVLIVLAGAVVVAFVVALLVQVGLGKNKKPAPVQIAQVEVLVAAADLPFDKELAEGDLQWQSWPKNSVFPGAVIRKEGQTPTEALKGRLNRKVSKGEPVTEAALMAQGGGNIIASKLKPGTRAVAIEVSAASMAGGFIGPGDFVDVLLTYKETIKMNGDDDPRVENLIEMNLDKMATETVLQNVRILAVDQTAERAASDKVKVGRTVTLAVTAQDAEKLFLASEMGQLLLALRGEGDDVIVKKQWGTVTDARMTSIEDEILLEYNKLKNDTGINPQNVRIYNGAQVQTVTTR